MVKLTQEFVKAALTLADIGQSKIGERERELFGLSSPRLKALLNNLCSKENTNYLELGVYKGSTLISAAFGNTTNKVVGIENYSYDEREPKRKAPEGLIWENMKSHLKSNITRYEESGVPINTANITIIESDFQEVDWKAYPKFDLCFFDIVPADREVYKAFFDKTIQALSSEAVIVFTNYSNTTNAKLIDELLADNEHKFTIQWKEQRISGGLSDNTQYYSGILLISIKKKIIKADKVST
jgi:hypothetical protein